MRLPERAPASNVRTVSVWLRVSATKGWPYVASTSHTVPASSGRPPTLRPPAGTVYSMTSLPSPGPMGSCVISTLLSLNSSSVCESGLASPEIPVTGLFVGCAALWSVTVQSPALKTSAMPPKNSTSVVCPSTAVALKIGTYAARACPPA